MQTDTILTHINDITLSPSFYERELPVLIQKIKNDCGWKMGDLKSQLIINDANRKVLITALHSKTEIISHQTDEFIIINILEGSLKLSLKKETITLSSGQKFTLIDNVKYKLEALTETIYLLIISPKNYKP